MMRLLAFFKLGLIMLSAIGWIVFVPFASVVHGPRGQGLVALVATVLLFGDVGPKAAISTLRALVWVMAWFWGVTLLLFEFGLVTSEAFLVPAYFYSTMIGVNWLVRRIGLRDILTILSPGRGRTTLIVLRAFFDTASTDVPRLAWYSESMSAPIKPRLGRAFVRVLSTVLATFIWLGQDVPAKMAIVENRQRHLEGLR